MDLEIEFEKATDPVDFASFLMFCAERLEKGQSVAEIWEAYQTAQQ